MRFEDWLAKLLGQGEQDVKLLLEDKTALHFLVVWSIFESKCFNGYVKLKEIDGFCERIIKREAFESRGILEIASHFHARYQDAALYRHLMQDQKSPRMEDLLKRSFESLSAEEQVFIAALTTYRYRNNVFHGNKGVDSWLGFKPQIRLCTEAMKAFIDHAEARAPSLKTAAAV